MLAALIAAAILVAKVVASLAAPLKAIFVAVDVVSELSIVNVTEFPAISFTIRVLVLASPAVLLNAVIVAVAPLTSPLAFIQFEPVPFKVRSL